MTWGELLTEAGDILSRAGISEARIDAWELFSECFSMSRAEYFLRCVEKVSDAQALEKFTHMVRLRSERIPLQQITGHQNFMGLEFLVNEHVLIPRQDTEVLVETVLDDLKKGVLRTERLRILDMCAGSGCIGISLERLAPVSVSVLGVDVSDEALKVAKENGRRLGCEHYDAVKSDLFERIEGKFDVIVSNPPYIATAVIETLEAEVKDHEPRLALDGEADGLTFYRRLTADAPNYLTENGRIYFEIGYDQGEAVSELLRENGFSEIRVIRDLAGLDRVVAAVWKR
ncbi:MAG: peptide chain release factor N(5)-glutamine methyltransferase [Lachnospiraceae bacterium]|nr:peptide chain release factor N(5)-glutamine methyltransferase [Lachnospiraceae bacterium]